jgi:hypothetical protein
VVVGVRSLLVVTRPPIRKHRRLAIAFRGGQAYIVGRAGVHSGNSGSYPSGDLTWVQGALILWL